MRGKVHAKKALGQPEREIIKPIEIDDGDPLADPEIKIPDEGAAEEEDLEAEEAGLNEEDLDPFGDKWEE